MSWFKKKTVNEFVYFSVPVIANRAPSEEDKHVNVWIHRNENVNDVYFLSRIENERSIWIKL